MTSLRIRTTDTKGNGRPLHKEEMKTFFEGYLSERQLSQAERETFGLVWAVYYADKLSFYVEKPGRVKGSLIRRWDLESQIRKLPEAIADVSSLLN